MTRSGYEWTAELQRTVATPYKETGEPWPHYQFAEQGSGGLYTTIGDLARFVAAALPGPAGEPAGRGIVPPDSLARMLTPAEGTQGAYGLGYKFLPVPGGPVLLWHDGANEGWRANFFLNRATRDAFVILTNSDAGGRIAAPIVCSWAATTAFDMSGLCATVRR
jgi:CubicO group peptidase (beta-lactamase class C family)